jgi:hypothetical protein
MIERLAADWFVSCIDSHRILLLTIYEINRIDCEEK